MSRTATYVPDGDRRARRREVRELRAEIRQWRRGRADARLIDVLQDAYVAVVTALMLSSMLISVLVHVSALAARLCTAPGCQEARTALPWLAGLTAVVAVLALARLLGPVFVTPAVASWIIATPVDRAAVLRPRMVATLTAAAAITAAGAAAAGTLGGFAVGPVTAFGFATALVALTVVAFAASTQTAGPTPGAVLTRSLAALLWLALLVLAAGDAPALGPPRGTSGAGWAVVAGIGAVAVAASVTASRRLPRLHTNQITAGGALAPGLSGALSSLDFALGYDVLLAHRWNAHPPVRPRRAGPAGPAAVLWTDLARLRRSPGAPLLLAAAAVIPYCAAVAGTGTLIVLVATATGFLAGLPLLTALRVLTRTPSLTRMLPFPDSTTRRMAIVLPTLLLVGFGAAVSPALHRGAGLPWPDATAAGVAVGFVALAAGCRWVTGRPPDYTRPLVSTPAGGVPTNLYGSALRGFDILLLGTVPMLLSASVSGAEISMLISLAVLAYLTGRK